ncbi:MAG: branched-chain amino acid ABC transporter permease [Actinomycetota bacterium]
MPEELATLLQHLVNALSISSIYVLLGTGLTLIFGLSRLINFAHGQFLVLGGFLAWQLTESGVNYFVAAGVAMIAVGALGVASDVLLFRRTIGRPMDGFVASLGLAIALQAVMAKIWSADLHQIDKPLVGVWEFGDVDVPKDRVLVFGVVAIVVVALFLVLEASGLGRSLKAAAENPDAARLIGVNVGMSIAVSFFLGSAMAALGGALIGMVVPFTALGGGQFIIKGFAVALIGGLGNVRGAALAGVLLGLVETLGSAYEVNLGIVAIGSEWRDGFAFGLMIVLLAWRPQGLFRTRERV